MELQFDNLAFAIIFLLVGSAVFITGMNMMSSGLKKSTGKGLKKLFNRIRNNRFAGFGIGASVTAIIQSSAATSVMVVGFINAGVMAIFQGVSIIIGAYLGTTVTGLLVSLSSFNISGYFMILAFIGAVLMFFNKPLIKNIGEILTGLGILFLGLDVLKGAFKYNEISSFCQTLFTDISFPLLLVVIGAIITALVQSSSATTGIVIVMLGNGVLGTFTTGMYLALGATIGTVITTLLATIGGNANAKRVGFIALIIRIIGALLIMGIIWIFNNQINDFVLNNISPEQYGISLALFTIAYNLVFAAIMLPLLRPLEKISIAVIHDKNEEKKKLSLKFIDDRLLNTPSIAMLQVKKEIENMSNMAYQNFELGYKMVIDHDLSSIKELEEREEAIDYINNQITNFLINLSQKVELNDEKIVGSYFHVINDIERIGDHANNFADMAKKMIENDLKFSTNAKNEFTSMYDVLEEMFAMSMHVFDNSKSFDLNKLHELEERTDELKNNLSDAHFERITKNLCHVELSPFYSTFLSELERIADHLTNIGYSVVNPTGDEI